MGRAAAIGIVLVAGMASADEVFLRSGGRLSGVVIGQNATSVQIEVGAGVVTVPRSIIESIALGPSALSQYQTRLRALGATDSAGWLELAEFARTAGLSGQAREAYRRVLALDPENAVARRALGYQKVGDQWLTREEAMQSQGYVLFDGEWVTPVQRDSVLAERESARREHLEAERSRAALAEAEARAREAEARARTAEAEAQRAEERARERASLVFTTTPWGWGTTGSPFLIGPACPHSFHTADNCPFRSGHRSSFGGSGLSIEWRTSPAPAPSPAPTSAPRREQQRRSSAKASVRGAQEILDVSH